MNNSNKVTTAMDRLDIGSIVRDVLKNSWAILLLALAAAMAVNAAVRTNHQTTYATRATFIVKSRTASNYTYSNLTAASRMAEGFTNILNSSLLKKKVAEDLGVDSLDARMSAAVVSETNLMTLSVTADTPRNAYLIIRSIMDNMKDLTSYVSGDMVMEVLQEPDVPAGANANFSARSQTKKGFIGGLAAGVVLFALLSFLKDTVKNERDIENQLNARNIGVLYHESGIRRFTDLFRKRRKYHLISDVSARFEFVERMKKIATNVSGHAKRNGHKVILVTSVKEDEGKSTVAANLALALARQSHSVLLIDGDLRRPTQQKFFLNPGEKLEKDIVDVLDEPGEIRNVIRYDKANRLYTLLLGESYKNSTDIVAGSAMREMIKAAGNHFEYVIIDSPPMSLIADAEILAGLSDMSLLVVRYDRARIGAINNAIDTLTGCKADFYGCILNDVRTLPWQRSSVAGTSGYGRYGRYGRYGNYSRYGKYGRYGRYGNYGEYGHYAKK